ncbi:NAD-dependent epimerase/dehydratase family protein, partial [Nisaea sediminum]|uniref:NAD-dependent epimerase/dehydratase family protein n=1 Tax=Nisaea sediminum TaxID=2775867 RepID=UPI001D0120B3
MLDVPEGEKFVSRRFNKVLITGGAGYVGSLLIPQLLDLGYEIVSYDIQFFGDDFLPKDDPK